MRTKEGGRRVSEEKRKGGREGDRERRDVGEERTSSVVRKFERRSSFLNVDVEDVVVLYSVVKLTSI